MKYSLLVLVSLLIALPANSQDFEIDQIKAEISNHPQEDTVRVNRLNTLARTVGVPLDIKLDAVNEALIISRTLNYVEGEGYALANLGYISALKSEKSEADSLLQQADSIAKRTNNENLTSYILARKALNERSADNRKALNYGLEAEEIALKTGNKQGQYDAQAIIGNIYQNMLSDFPNALKYRLKAVATAEETGSLRNRATSLAALATFYISIGDQKNSILYYEKAITANNKLGNKTFTRVLLSNIGTRYALDGNYVEAIKNFKLSLEGETNPGGILINENNLADAYTNMDSIPIALKYAFRSLAMANELDDINSYSSINGVLSRAYLKKNMVDSAIYYGEQGLAAANESQTIGNIRDNSFALANAYAFKKDYQNAYVNYERYIFYRDSILNNEITNKTNVLQYNYDLAKKESQIAELHQQQRGQRIFLIGALIVLGLITITVIALVRSNRIKQKANKLLKKQKREIQDQRDQTNKALIELKQTQAQLIQSEKMASLGELTAGIAHEIQNPLNFVNNFSEVSNELIDEMNEELANGNQQSAMEIALDIKQNLDKINHHGKRADFIVKGMLQHSRSSNSEKEPTDINALCEEFLKLAYHGLRANLGSSQRHEDKTFNANLKTDFDPSIGRINVSAQDIGRVVLNLINNAFYAVQEKAKAEKSGFDPVVSVSTKKVGDTIEICVSDNGNGIPEAVKEKIFQPFFTTKPSGQGTGLGLSLSYDIVKAHGGEVTLNSKENEGTIFTVVLPQ